MIRVVFLAAIAAVALLAWLPLSPPELSESHGDKLNHIAAFLLLYLLFRRAWNLPVPIMVALLFSYGMLLETVQYFLPYRTFSWLDIAADLVGIALGVVTAAMLTKWPGPREMTTGTTRAKRLKN